MTRDTLLDGIDHPILFIFDDAIAEGDNLRKIWHTPRKNPDNPVLGPEKPWEGNRIQPWGSVLRFGDNWRLLYSTRTAGGPPSVCALDSADGKTWHRPDLGLHEYDGDARNNILFPAQDEREWFLPSLIRHPDPPDESWTYLFYTWGKEGDFHTGLTAYKSRDGLHFEPLPENPVVRWGLFGPGQSNDVAMTYWDRQAGTFRIYVAVLLPQTPGLETTWDNCPQWRRCLGRLESDDGVTWRGPELMLVPDRNEPEWQQYYGVTVSEYAGLWIAFPLYYNVREQFIQPHVAFSRDGLTWERPTRQPFLPTGDSPDRWDCGTIVLAWDFLRIGDELVFPYGGQPTREHSRRSGMALGYATMRRDGFVSLAPGTADPLDAYLTTVPLANAPGRRLALNTEPDWTHDAWLRVEVQTADGAAVEGYALDDCARIESDAVETPVRWGENGRLPADRGPLRLRVHLHQQRLYSISFSG